MPQRRTQNLLQAILTTTRSLITAIEARDSQAIETTLSHRTDLFKTLRKTPLPQPPSPEVTELVQEIQKLDRKIAIIARSQQSMIKKALLEMEKTNRFTKLYRTYHKQHRGGKKFDTEA